MDVTIVWIKVTVFFLISIYLSWGQTADSRTNGLNSTTNQTSVTNNDISPSTTNDIPTPRNRWYTNGNIVSQIDFETLEKDFSIIIQTNEKEPASIIINLISDEEKKAINTLIRSTNVNIISLFSNYSSNDESNIIISLSNLTVTENPPSFDNISEITLIQTPLLGQVSLENADVLESISIKKKGLSESIVEISGKVRIQSAGVFVKAEKATINSENNTIFAEGDLIISNNSILIKGEKAMLDVNEQRGFIYKPSGVLNDFIYQGELGKWNSNQHVTIKNSYGTFETNEKPTYRFSASTVENFGPEQSMQNNLVFQIHNHPFYWFPFYLEDPFGVGLVFRYGITENEGLFFETSFSASFPEINTLNFDINLYEKVGAYFRVRNANSFPFHNYNLSLALARYLETGITINDVFDRDPRFVQSVSSADDPSQDYSYRYKLNYNHTFNFTSQEDRSRGVSSSISYAIKKTGRNAIEEDNDPFFSHDLENRNPRQFEYSDLWRNPDLDNYETPRNTANLQEKAKETDAFSFNFAQTLPGTRLDLSGNWKYQVEELQSIVDFDATDTESFRQFLQSVTLPDLSLSHSGIIDPLQSDVSNQTSLNIGYSVNTSYKLTTHYTNNGKTVTNRNDVRDAAIRYEDNLFKIGFNLNRSFSLTEDVRKQKLKALDMSYTPSIAFNYQRQWGGEQDAAEGQTRTTVNEANTYYTIGFNNGLTFNFPSIHQQRTNDGKVKIFNATYSPSLNFDIREEADERNRTESRDGNTGLKFNQTLNLYFPSREQRNTWDNRTGYWPMIPKWDITFSHNLSKTNALDATSFVGDPFYFWSAHNFHFRTKLSHNGYGLFFIPYFDFSQEVNFQLSYNNLIPPTNQLGEYQPLVLPPLTEGSTQSNIDNFDLTYNLNLFVQPPNFNYRVFNFSYYLTYQFLENISTGIKVVDPKVNNHRFISTLTYKQTNINPNFYVKNLTLGASYQRFERLEEYQRDNMSFSLVLDVSFLKYFSFSINFSAINNDAWLYRQEAGNRRVDFFEDLWASFGFLGNSAEERIVNQQRALFKFNNITFALTHDLDTWFLEASYTISPNVVSSGASSLQGFYLNQKFDLTINLRPQYELPELQEGIEPWEVDFTPEDIRNSTFN